MFTLVLAVSVLAAGAAAAQTQTSPEQCGNGELLLVSPERAGLDIRLSELGRRFGAYVQWDEMSDEYTTCRTIRRADTLHTPIELGGVYRDDIDREFRFEMTLAGGGEVGSRDINRLVFTWKNRFVSRSGALVGAINLSNSGGLLRYDRASGEWSQVNTGLPSYLPFSNVAGFSQSPSNPGRLLTHFSGGTTPLNGPRGLWAKYASSDWSRIAPEVFTDSRSITATAFSPDDPQRFAVGTAASGLFVTADGGQTFTQYALNLAPSTPNPPVNFNVTALRWTDDDRLFVAILAFGLFVSDNGGQSFTKLSNLLVPQVLQQPGINLAFPEVRQIVQDPHDPEHILVAVRNHALYHSPDGGVNWSPGYGDGIGWVHPDSTSWRHTGTAIVIDPNDADNWLVGTSQKGIFRSIDGGATWQRVALNVLPQSVSIQSPVASLLFDPVNAQRVFAFADILGIIVSEDDGATWSTFADQPSIVRGTSLTAVRGAGGDLFFASYGGGIYVPYTPIALSSTIDNSLTYPENRGLDLGIDITFGPGFIEQNTTFDVVCQDFQGWAVWRSDNTDPDAMVLIGLYDKTNPETCIEGFCGDENYNITPNCYSEKRAACFDFSEPGSVTFFDDNIYNGFTYYYAVTTFDYGNTAGVEPVSLSAPLKFSPRYEGDDISEFYLEGENEGNRVTFEVNLAEEGPIDGEEIYVFPNPLRRDAGFPGFEGEQVVFTNLPADSRILVFTADGDKVADLHGDLQVGANMYWVTRNEDNELLGSGIYIWKVEMPQRGDFYGKLIIIR
jgi:photosystem II stability/assembly factor-like uncharacterized protein